MSEIARVCRPVVLAAMLAFGATGVPASAQDNYDAWPALRSTFPSTGGNGIMIKGYDPVITGGKCITTFMAVPEGKDPPVYTNVVEFEAVELSAGILCRNGKWRSFDGATSGTTPYRMYFKEGIFRGSP